MRTLDHLFWIDLALGPAVACLLAALATGRPAGLLRLLDARPLRRLGASSYSLYLTHFPIVIVVYERVVAGRFSQGVPAFLVTSVLAAWNPSRRAASSFSSFASAGGRPAVSFAR